MSIRAKLVWGFLLVTMAALSLSFLTANLGLYSTMMANHHGSMMMDHGPMSPTEFVGVALRWSVLASLAAFGIAGLVGVVVAERITRPLRALRSAAAGLDLRDLTRRVKVEGTDETAELAATFNRMCERLEADERSRRHLLADTAHELRTPLAVLQGHLDLMQDGKVELTPEALLPVQDEVIRLTRLVGDLRDLSLAEVGALSLHRSQVEPAVLLDGLLANLGPVAAAKGVALTGEAAADLPALQADPDRLRQVLINLLANALQYTPSGERIAVRAWAEGGRLYLSVTDTGPGISPEDLPYLFDRFYRADKSRSRETGGSGLGLAIVRSLVELHGGQVKVESTPGQGSCFTLWLPLAGG